MIAGAPTVSDRLPVRTQPSSIGVGTTGFGDAERGGCGADLDTHVARTGVLTRQERGRRRRHRVADVLQRGRRRTGVGHRDRVLHDRTRNGLAGRAVRLNGSLITVLVLVTASVAVADRGSDPPLVAVLLLTTICASTDDATRVSAPVSFTHAATGCRVDGLRRHLDLRGLRVGGRHRHVGHEEIPPPKRRCERGFRHLKVGPRRRRLPLPLVSA